MARRKVDIKLEALQRWGMWHWGSGRVPYYLVTEYPKSGGTWLAQLLAAYLQIPFPRNRRPRLNELWRPCVLHGHHLYSPHFHNTICLIRDGRDVMVSAYYHRLLHSDKNIAWAVDQVRRQLPFVDYEDIRHNLPAFIDYMFTQESQGRFRFRWDEFFHSWANRDVPIIHYEAMLRDTVAAVGPALRHLTGQPPDPTRLAAIAHNLSFANQAKRQPGQEERHSFLRKGIAGDWKNVFSREAGERFAHYAGQTLIALGYEEDSNWVQTLS